MCFTSQHLPAVHAHVQSEYGLNCGWRLVKRSRSTFKVSSETPHIPVAVGVRRLELPGLAPRHLEALGVDAATKKLLASEGYDPQFCARPLKRAIQENLLDPLATKLLAGEFKPERERKGVRDD
ncbi:MAG: hypothetical protein H7Y43_11675 [Akkermansiaceae bacterium]|nr:hypothetical protein [Verrucomicrobiales bacterium]